MHYLKLLLIPLLRAAADELSPTQKKYLADVLKLIVGALIGAGLVGCTFYGRYERGGETVEVGGRIDQPPAKLPAPAAP